MSKDYKNIVGDINGYTRELRQLIPDVMHGFSEMAKGSTQTKVIDQKTKELIALALGVAAHCDGCLGFHTKTLAQLGATRRDC